MKNEKNKKNENKIKWKQILKKEINTLKKKEKKKRKKRGVSELGEGVILKIFLKQV